MNGQIEKAVQTFKESLKMLTEADIETCIFRIFLEYHITPDTITGLLSAELLMERILSFVATSTSTQV